MAHEKSYLICESKCFVEGVSKEEHDADITKMAELTEGMDERISTAETNASNALTNASTALTQANSAKTGLVQVQNSISQAQSDITALGTRVTNMENSGGVTQDEFNSKVKELESDILYNSNLAGANNQWLVNLDSEVDAIDGRLTTAENRINGLDSQAVNNAQVLIDVKQRVEALEAGGTGGSGSDSSSGGTSCSCVVDDALDLDSTNPVENMVVTAAIEGLRTSYDTLGDAVDGWVADLEVAEGDISTLKSDVSSMATEIGTMATRVNEAETKALAAESAVSSMESDITALQTDVSDNSDALVVISGTVTQNSTKITTLTNTVTSHTAEISTLEDDKQDMITGAATTVTSSDLTANRALISNSSGKIAVSPYTTSTELGYLQGLTENVQDAIDELRDSTNTGNRSIQYGYVGTINGSTNLTFPKTVTFSQAYDTTPMVVLQGGWNNSTEKDAPVQVYGLDTTGFNITSNSDWKWVMWIAIGDV